MAKSNKGDKQNKKSTPDENKLASLWMRHGIDDVYYQRDAHVTFWSVLGGIAVAALLTQIANLMNEIKSGNWHLLFYFFTSINMITLSWVSHLWGSLVLKLRVTILHTFLLLSNLICLCIVCLFFTDPVIFFSAGVFFVFLALLIQLYIKNTGGWTVFTDERIKGIRMTLWMWLASMVIFLCATAQLYWYPSTLSELIWGVLVFLASTGSLVMQHYGMEQERKDLGIP